MIAKFFVFLVLLMSTKAEITQKIDKLIDSVTSAQIMSTSKPNNEVVDEKQCTDAKPTAPEQPSSEYDLTKPYRISVQEGNQGGAEKLRIVNFDIDNLKL